MKPVINNLQRSPSRSKQLLAAVVAIPSAIAAGFATVLLLDAVLPHGKSWQLPLIFGCGWIAAIASGIACFRRIER